MNWLKTLQTRLRFEDFRLIELPPRLRRDGSGLLCRAHPRPVFKSAYDGAAELVAVVAVVGALVIAVTLFIGRVAPVLSVRLTPELLT